MCLPGKHLICLALTAVICLVSIAVRADDDQSVVRLSTGTTLRGKRVNLSPYQLKDFRKSLSVYTRLPYAEPPVGELRYALPVPKSPSGDFDATREPVACPQIKSPDFYLNVDLSEDCLYLDVFVPEPKPTSAAVMFWIHGGGYQAGAGFVPELSPTFLAAYGEVIVVTINYRLGPLGFLTTGNDDIPGNLGLWDQRQAMLWVQENIAAFGGDPSRVTIFGESAGSGSVNLHMLSTMSAGLFARAILQSGAINDFWSHHGNKDDAAAMAFDFGKAVGCETSVSAELVTCLRGKTFEDFGEVYNLTSGPTRFFFRPVADGHFLLDDPFKLAKQGSFNPGEVLLGCLQDEGTLFIIPSFAGKEGHDRPVFSRSDFANLVGALYSPTDSAVADSTTFVYSSAEMLQSAETDHAEGVIQFLGDVNMMCPTFALADDLAGAGRTVFAFVMDHVPSHSLWGSNYTWLGAAHGEDIIYVLGTPFALSTEPGEDDRYNLIGRFEGDAEIEISIQMVRYWSTFAKTGDPNIPSRSSEDSTPRYPSWPKFTILEPVHKRLSEGFENRAGRGNAKTCYYLKELLPSLREMAAENSRLKALLEEKVSADSAKTCQDEKNCP
ncbi:acetylcholinesterase-like [Diadema setosum]|uniref:acetylcholinesterase-like n=1 Tax=Diadema setosum TaxID=31175 RepID=UPI003B3A4C61